ncbi:hypothetical protein NPX13_g2113 [Xylaria arbuscula]|uniref:Uncharacterized protein n=1 Tax=Xylaria arbuscula TaxID=114810 RepID=A0A9W8TQQ4_9PEZI|nr:hypothetical protein NPX13_g2113 [Xylaria arbuscula]
MASEQPQQPEFVLVGGESTGEAMPSETEKLAEILQRLDAIDKNFNDRLDGLNESRENEKEGDRSCCLELAAKGQDSNSDVNHTVQISDITKRLDVLESRLDQMKEDHAEDFKSLHDEITDIQDYGGEYKDCMTKIEQAMAAIEARQNASEKNALARILNSRYMARYESLEPLVSLKNQPIWKFPSSLERLDSMTVDDVNLVLQALGQPHQGDITKARRRLALLAGCIAIAY